MEDYEALLDRARSQIPDIVTEKSRFVVPLPKVFSEGRTTVLDNFGDIADVLNRDMDTFLKFLLQELGTAGKIDGGRAIFQGNFPSDVIKSHIDDYVEEYVICSECRRPDTHLIKSERILMLQCDACGGHRPVKKRRIRTETKKEIEEGEIYEFRIDAIGNKGDGIAKMNKYTIFIPNVSKGSIVKAKIKKISGTLAFAELVEQS
ncbi:MAG: translation initiation factor IF-2 subunit beta [Methanocellales archaeon]|nr:translation initiation factor IF-2 subunit beta [Methanocellales archaeon]MDD3292073.1 translation initiation factor IF-2 subunit beta [Methanocellales archaeon]MDD5235546.1 translation initiation factor IF-2 subunit beta [Methanocellales archaeon]MDD5485570.1 translation initiation factor IF-2 subunit beta [Methanocellales archaeon]